MPTYILYAFNTDSRYPRDIRWREYTKSKKRADLFKRIPKIQFTDSGHGIAFWAVENAGRKRLPVIRELWKYVGEQTRKLMEEDAARLAEERKKRVKCDHMKPDESGMTFHALVWPEDLPPDHPKYISLGGERRNIWNPSAPVCSKCGKSVAELTHLRTKPLKEGA